MPSDPDSITSISTRNMSTTVPMNICPKCHRPFNEGNSPNSEECNGTDDEEGLCKAYAEVYKLRTELENIYKLVTPEGKDLPFGIYDTANTVKDLMWELKIRNEEIVALRKEDRSALKNRIDVLESSIEGWVKSLPDHPKWDWLKTEMSALARCQIS